MSAGHTQHRHASLPKDLEALLTPQLLTRARKTLAKAKDAEGYNNPYLAGRSTNFRNLYVDPVLPRSIKVGKEAVNTRKTVGLHEAVEWELMNDGHDYGDSHRVANAAERQVVTSLGVDWKRYCSVLDTYVEKAERAKIRRVPVDLDLRPFQDDPKRLAALKSRMGKDGARSD